MTRPPRNRDWQPIEGHVLARLDELFKVEPNRLQRMTLDVAGIHFDWSKTHLDAALTDRLSNWPKRAGSPLRAMLYSPAHRQSHRGPGGRAVAERGQATPKSVALAAEPHTRMRSLIDAIEAGAFGDIDSILHIGSAARRSGPTC